MDEMKYEGYIYRLKNLLCYNFPPGVFKNPHNVTKYWLQGGD